VVKSSLDCLRAVSVFVIAGLLQVANFVPVKRGARTSADDTSDRTLDGRDIVTRQVRANDFAYIV
jgi:hypothetical protein